jgi:hypothetical protein
MVIDSSLEEGNPKVPRKKPKPDQSDDQESVALQKLQRAQQFMRKLNNKRKKRWDPFDDQNGKESPYLRKG